MKKVCCTTMDGLREGNITMQKSVFIMALILAMSASPAFALTTPSGAGLGMALYTICNGLYTTGLGYVIAACMFIWGCVHLPRDWQHSLGWIVGGIGVGSIPTLVTAAGLIL